MAEKEKILGVITARGGSKGIPGKNIKELGGKPLIAYTIEVAQKSKLITHLIVSTDDEEIAAVAKQYGGEVPFMRPDELAQDETPHVPVIQHAVEEMEKREGITFDYIVIFQPTSPFRLVEDIDGTIEKLIETGADSAVSVTKVEASAHPMKMKKLIDDKILPYVMEETSKQRQELPEVYKRSSAVYAMKRSTIMNKDSTYGEDIAGYYVPEDRSIDIDTPQDWAQAEYMLKDLEGKGLKF